MSNGRSLQNYACLSNPHFEEIFDFKNKFIVDELNYDKEKLSELHASLIEKLTNE